jgi:Ring finger domain
MRVANSVAKCHGFFVVNRLPEIFQSKYLYSAFLLLLYGFMSSGGDGLIQVVHAQLGGRGNSLCRINDEPIKILSYDTVQGTYLLLDENMTTNQTFSGRHERLNRHLRHSNHYQYAPQLAEESDSMWSYTMRCMRLLFQRGRYDPAATSHENSSSASAISALFQSEKLVSRNAAMNLQIPENNGFIQVHECDCASRFQPQEYSYSFYCPLNKHYCSVSYSSYPLCINAPTASTYLAVNLKLFAITSLTVLIVWLCVSLRGNFAIAFCGSHLCPYCFKGWYLNYLIKHRPALVSKILRRWIEERRERLEARYRELQRLNGDIVTEDSIDIISAPLPPLDPFEESLVREVYESRPSLILKTRLYMKAPTDLTASDSLSPHVRNTIDTDSPEFDIACPGDHKHVGLVDSENSKDDFDDIGRNGFDRDNSCMICFAVVFEGERVGIMPNCDHIFHSKCLKDWLKRRNVCPLCLDANVAVFSSSPRSKKSQTQLSPQADGRQRNSIANS